MTLLFHHYLLIVNSTLSSISLLITSNPPVTKHKFSLLVLHFLVQGKHTCCLCWYKLVVFVWKTEPFPSPNSPSSTMSTIALCKSHTINTNRVSFSSSLNCYHNLTHPESKQEIVYFETRDPLYSLSCGFNRCSSMLMIARELSFYLCYYFLDIYC